VRGGALRREGNIDRHARRDSDIGRMRRLPELSSPANCSADDPVPPARHHWAAERELRIAPRNARTEAQLISQANPAPSFPLYI
jgi:hypothetical protein